MHFRFFSYDRTRNITLGLLLFVVILAIMANEQCSSGGNCHRAWRNAASAQGERNIHSSKKSGIKMHSDMTNVRIYEFY